MNAHHLELFYYVAKYEGITAAVKRMPYGIQQPAVSGQILQLEASLGVQLFNRRPFALTPEGEDLYDYVYPFFSRMSVMEERLKGDSENHLRICASAAVLKHHLPDILERMKLKNPELRISLQEVEQDMVQANLLNQESDIAILAFDNEVTSGLKMKELIQLPLVMLVPDTIKVKTFSDLLEPNPNIIQKRGEAVAMRAKIPLVGLSDDEVIQQIFQKKIAEDNLHWDVSVGVSSLSLIQSYVSRGFGAGLGLSIPGLEYHADGCNVVKLDDFPPLRIGALYVGKIRPIAEEFLNETIEYIKGLS